MTSFDRAFNRLASRIVLPLFGLMVLAWVGIFAWLNRGALTRANDVVVGNPTAAVRDARAFIPLHLDSHMMRPDELPPSLRIKGLRWANVHNGHIDLVIARNPDISMGARIWLPGKQAPHHEAPTRYHDIWFYRYDNDVAVSAENMP